MPYPHPQLIDAKLDQLHPTQITVGMLEVALKRKQWGELGRKSRAAALAGHWFPVIAATKTSFTLLTIITLGWPYLRTMSKRSA